jgi:uncharacterized repeat protein (TIGR02543 family)
MMKKGLFAFLAVLTVFAMVMTGCDDGGGSGGGNDNDIAVTLSSVTATGAPTTSLTLTFDKAIDGLAAGDITVTSSTGATKGALSGSNPYTLTITGVTTGGDASVAVKKSGYKISGSPKTVAIVGVPAGLVIDKPELEVDELVGTGNAVINNDGSITLGNAGRNNTNLGGALKYKFPNEALDYDYFQVDFEITDPTAPLHGRDFEVRFLQYYEAGTAQNALVPFGKVPEYLSLAADQSKEKFKVMGRNFAPGFAWAYNSWEWDLAGSPARSPEFTILINKITFTKAVKYQITFDSDGGSACQPITVWADEAIDAITPLPVPTKAGFNFNGWYDGETSITNSTIPSGNLSLKAKWAEAVAATEFTVTFTEDNLSVSGNGTVDIIDGGAGYQFHHNGGYQGTYAKFTITLQTGVTLGSYSKVTVDVKGISGDVGWKNIVLLAGETLPTFGSDPSTGSFGVTDNPQFNGGATGTTMELTINAAKAATLTGTFEASVYMHSGAGEWEISNVTFTP